MQYKPVKLDSPRDTSKWSKLRDGRGLFNEIYFFSYNY